MKKTVSSSILCIMLSLMLIFVGCTSTDTSANKDVTTEPVVSNAQTSADESETVSESAEESSSSIPIYTADIVVAGSGVSGMCAAIQAAQNGASVILLEKLSHVGGNSLFAEGAFAVDSSMQKELGIEFGVYDAIQNEMELSNYRANAQIWLDYLRASGENIDWMIDLGVTFQDVRAGGSGIMGWHYYTKEDGVSTCIARLYEKVQELGITVLLETPATSLIEENGIITGVMAETAAGEVIEIRSDAVILATGGVGRNPELLTALTGFDCTYATIDCSVGNTGDGVVMAIAAGADTHTTCVMGDKTVYGYNMFAPIAFAATRQPLLWVNQLGERFVGEDIVMTNIPFACNAIWTQDQCYSIIDQATIDQFTTVGCPDDFNNYFGTGSALTDLPAQIEEALSSDRNNVFKADSIEELAEIMGVPADTLTATVSRYNELCAAGEDADFYKSSEYMISITEGPFYAFRFDPVVVCAVGGIKTNNKNEVIHTDGNAIPGLYAVGLDGCMLYEETYNMMLSGSCNGYGIFSGRTAANSALEYIRTK